MQNVMDMKRNKPDIISFIKQAGVSSLLFIVLVGLSLTVLTVGYMSTMRNLQSSATTTHAQTQAQMQAMIGYHAFSKYLNQLSKEDNGLRLIDQLCNGEIEESNPETQIKFERVGACNNPVLKDQYKFDIIGKSGGASAILRANFNLLEELKTGQQTGSIFAGGLTVGKLDGNQAHLIADGVTLEVKDGEIYGQNDKPYTELGTITVKEYVSRNFVKPEDFKDNSNYIFTVDENGDKFCELANLKNSPTKVQTTCPDDTYVSFDKSSKTWTLSGKVAETGAFWFDGNVILELDKDKVFISTVIATDNITTILKNHHQNQKYYAFAPYHYYLQTLEAARLNEICPENYPLQYCSGKGQLKYVTLDELYSTIANILFLSQTLTLEGGKSQQNVDVQYHGNMIANTGVNQNSASAKFNATGVINIYGNLMLVGEADNTHMQGNFSLKLNNADTKGNYIPVYEKVFTIGGIRYM
ncbi:hypothetical protein AB2762_01695 [Acinetobacter indicus]